MNMMTMKILCKECVHFSWASAYILMMILSPVFQKYVLNHMESTDRRYYTIIIIIIYAAY